MENNTGCQNKPTLCEWFNPDNYKHICSYNYLQATGTWPEGFLPRNIYVEPGWQAILAFKIANKWINHKLANPED